MYVNSLCELCLIAEHTENLSVCSWKYTGKKMEGKNLYYYIIF